MTAAPDRDPVATILITTRDRRERLAEALRSALMQTAEVEIIVLDDASSDGTPEMIGAEFPLVRLIRSEAPLGCPAQRNRGFEAARGAIVVCLDDDAWFSSPRTVEQVLKEFDDPRVAVVTIPYVNARRGESLRQHAPEAGSWATGTFAAGASALRREHFREVGGYVELGEHGEETDLAVRLLDRGRLVRLGRADHIVHDEAVFPKPARAYRFSSRNHLLGAWRNVPWPYLPVRLATVAARVTLHGARDGQTRAALGGVLAAARECSTGHAARAPVDRQTYVLARRLLRRGPLPLGEVTALFPSDADAAGLSRPLHVVSVLTTHAAGGAEFAAIDMLDALAGRGARVRLLTNRSDLVAGTRVGATPIALGPKLRRDTFAGVALRAPLTFVALVAALRREARIAPIDVLLVHFKKEQLLAALIPRSLATSVVWAEWGPLPIQLRSGAPRVAYALAARSADAVIAESAATERSLTEAGVAAAKIVVIPNVLDPAHLAFDATARASFRRRWGLEESFVLGAISRLDPGKRLDVVIDALGHLDDRVALVIAGEGDYERELRSRAERFGARVKFVGSARGHVAEILSACDVQVYAPSPSEGAPRAITFGQLLARPVIATAPEGARELVIAGTGTIVSPAHDARGLAGVVAAYQADPQRVADEGAAGRRHALRRIELASPLASLEAALRRACRTGEDERAANPVR